MKKVRNENEVKSCHWKLFCQTTALIFVVKGGSILCCARVRCKCNCKMGCVVFSLPVRGVWYTLDRNLAARGLRGETWLQTTFTFYVTPRRKPRGGLVPEISYNPLKELLFNAKYVNGGGWEIGLTFCCLKSEARCGQTKCTTNEASHCPRWGAQVVWRHQDTVAAWQTTFEGDKRSIILN